MLAGEGLTIMDVGAARKVLCNGTWVLVCRRSGWSLVSLNGHDCKLSGAAKADTFVIMVF
jgi:hypothetical protein